MRRLAAAVAVGLLCFAGAPSSPASPVVPARLGPAVFVVTGGGWGHGVGLSQWGAYGQALEGRSYREILAWYYRGTELGKTPVARVRVLLADGKQALRISSEAPFRVRDASSTTRDLPAGELTLGPALRLLVDGKRVPLEGPLRFQPGKGSQLALGGVEYRGELVVSREGARLRAINVLPLESYLLGVVAREMPKDWPLEALKAQAVAARTYSLTRFVEGKPFDLYADTRSQVYGGTAGEAPGAIEAVRATADEVVLYEGAIATTFYFSSSGGKTANGEDVFGTPTPYLVSVADPWDRLSPHHVWEPRLLSGADVAKAFALSSPVSDAVSRPTLSGRPTQVTLTTRAGGTLTAAGTDVRTRLGLRSQRFRLGTLRLDPPESTSGGSPLRLTGIARDVDGAALEKLGSSGWARVARLPQRPDGTFAVVVRPTADASYRLTAGGMAGPPLVVRLGSRAAAG
jgi:stage II sporulation protein D